MGDDNVNGGDGDDVVDGGVQVDWLKGEGGADLPADVTLLSLDVTL